MFMYNGQGYKEYIEVSGSCFDVKKFIKLIIIGIIAGTVLAESLRLLYVTTGINGYNLLFNFDYIPFIGEYSNTAGWTGMSFHYLACIGSVVVSYYVFKKYSIEKDMLPYAALFFIGSLMLYFLTGLSPEAPAWNDWNALIAFGVAHLLYAVVVAKLIQETIDELIFA